MGAEFGPGTPLRWIVLVDPLPDSAPAALDHFDWYDVGGQFDDRPAPADTTWGQLFEVRAVAPGEGTRVAIEAGDTIVVVPWAYDAECRLEPWTESVAWVPERPQVFRIAMGRRARSEGRAVFDVLGWLAPYPDGSSLRYDVPRESRRGRWLPAERYFDLLAHLSRRIRASSPDQRPSAFQSALEAWIEQNPEWADAVPVSLLR